MIESNWKHKKEQQRKYHKLLLITNNNKGERINWTKMKNWREEREKKKTTWTIKNAHLVWWMCINNIGYV